MRQTFDFERFDPPTLNERMLRRKVEERQERRRTVLLAIAGALLETALVLLGLLYWTVFPALGLGCFCFALISTAGGGAVAIVFVQKGGANDVSKS